MSLYIFWYVGVVWTVVVHPDAVAELAAVPSVDRLSLDHAMLKLRELGPALPFPHSSAIRGGDRIRELRPRAGRSRWRAFYRQWVT